MNSTSGNFAATRFSKAVGSLSLTARESPLRRTGSFFCEDLPLSASSTASIIAGRSLSSESTFAVTMRDDAFSISASGVSRVINARTGWTSHKQTPTPSSSPTV